MGRISWDEYFLKICNVVKLRSPDPTRQVGAVLVGIEDNFLISTGYNGLVSGSNDQIDWSDRTLVHDRIIHAEVNCILHSRNKDKKALKMYITTSPCKECIKLLASNGVSEIYYEDAYRDIILVQDICSFYEIKLQQMKFT